MKTTVAAICALALAAAAPAALAGDDDMGKKMDEAFAMMDTNKDGSISADEHRAHAEKMFAEADTNDDNMVSKEEMKAYKMQHHKAH